MTPVLSVICGTLNRERSYRRFVESLCRCATVPTELIVQDVSDEPYASSVPTPGIDCTVTIQKPRLGHVAGYSASFRKARGRWVTWMNDDCEMLPGWDTTAINFMEAHPEVGIGCIYFRDNIASGRSEPYKIQTIYHIVYPNFGFLRCEVGNDLGWFDQDLWMYGADTALAFSAIEAGMAVVGIPGCKVNHYREMDNVRRDNRVEARQSEDRKVFDSKWKFKAPDLRARHNRNFGHLVQPLEIP